MTEIWTDSRDPTAFAAWWAEVLDHEVVDADDTGATRIGPPGAVQWGPVPC